MGGKPLLAVAILGFPVDRLPEAVAARILDGAKTVCARAGIPLAGGHSIDTPEPIFGLSVNGLVDVAHLKRNNTAQAGDLLYLTKPLGIGILAAAAKRGVATEKELEGLVTVMSRLNDCGTALGRIQGVHAITDVTGFGLLGHLMEVCEGSAVTAQISISRLKMLEGAARYRDQFVFPDNTYRNWNAYEKKVEGISGPEFITLCDPQTSGGLLIAADPACAKDVVNVLASFGLHDHLEPIGRLYAAGEGALVRVTA
jgi:selenide,water dikinase